MIEVLPIKLLTDEESLIYGRLNVSLGKLHRSGLPVCAGIVVTPPEFKLKTVLENYNFGSKEVFEQSLNLVKKEISSIPIPEILQKETKGHKLLLTDKVVKSQKDLWHSLLNIWVEEIKIRLWGGGFQKGITEMLEPQVVNFIKNLKAHGRAYFDPISDEVVVRVAMGKLHPNDLQNLDEMVKLGNKKLFIPHEFEWIMDGSIKFTKVLPYTPKVLESILPLSIPLSSKPEIAKAKSAVSIFLDLSTGQVVDADIDGVYISSERIFDLNKPNESFENLILKLVESATTYPHLPILLKLADKSEGLGKLRGSLRLLHQQNLFNPLINALDFARHKKGLKNVHIVVPFVRSLSEFLQIKRELAVKNLSRKNSLQLWVEICTPENVINMEKYVVSGLDGVVLNLDELVSFINGFDPKEQELVFYKFEIQGLISFLEDSLKLLHKLKIPFIAYGSISLYPQVLDFLIEKGVQGIVVEKYEAASIKDLLHQTEKRMILRRQV